MSSNSRRVVEVSELKKLSIQFPGDVYILAVWVLANDLAYSKERPNSTRRTTIHGLSSKLSCLTNTSLATIESQFVSAGFDLGATIELDEQNSPNLLLSIASDQSN
jgi:hypothetical protein